MVLPLEVFLNEALGIDLEESGQLVASLSGTGAEKKTTAAAIPYRSSEHISVAGNSDVEALRQRMRQELVSVIAAAQAPVPMAAAAQRIRDRLGDQRSCSYLNDSCSFVR